MWREIARRRASARASMRSRESTARPYSAHLRCPARFQFFLVADTKRARAELAVLLDRFPGELEL